MGRLATLADLEGNRRWLLLEATVLTGVARLALTLVSFRRLARWLGRDWAERHVPEKLKRYEEKLEQHPIRTVVVLRLLLWINPAVDIAVGVSGVSLAAYVIGSVIALAPLTVLHVTLPAKGIELAGEAPDWLLPVVVVSAAMGLTIWLVRRRRAALTRAR